MGQRSSQVAAEAIVLPTAQRPRSSQVAAEAIILPTVQRPRSSQVVVEVVIAPSSPSFPGEPGGGVW